MVPEVAQLSEADGAEVAPVRFVPGMPAGVEHQRVLLAECPVADVALEGPGARVDALVADQLRRPRERLVAVRATVGVLSACVDRTRLSSRSKNINIKQVPKLKKKISYDQALRLDFD